MILGNKADMEDKRVVSCQIIISRSGGLWFWFTGEQREGRGHCAGTQHQFSWDFRKGDSINTFEVYANILLSCMTRCFTADVYLLLSYNITLIADKHQHREGISWACGGDLRQKQCAGDRTCVGPFEPTRPARWLSWVLSVVCLLSTLLEDNCSWKRPWSKDVLIICADHNTVSLLRCFSLKVCLGWCLVH